MNNFNPDNIDFPRNDFELKVMIIDWLERLIDQGQNSIILVEGKKDANALIELGIRGPINEINVGMNIFDLISMISSEHSDGDLKPTIIILTDWDRKGGLLAQRSKKACQRLDVNADLDWRKEISMLTGKWIKDIESLPAFISHLG